VGPGHLAAGFAVKPAAPKILLVIFLLASEALDLLSFLFIAMGIEDAGITQSDLRNGVQVLDPASIAWSHGLFMSVVWSLFFASIAYFFFKDQRVSALIGLVVFSHWILDFIVHPPDLPLLFTSSQKVGLGLWTSGPGFIFSIILEIVLVMGGITFYLIARRQQSVLETV